MNKPTLIPYILRKKAEHYTRTMERVSGVDPLEESRKRPVVIARTLVAYRLLLEGFSEHQVGVILGYDHSTINHYRQHAILFFALPVYYRAENELWEKFNKAI